MSDLHINPRTPSRMSVIPSRGMERYAGDKPAAISRGLAQLLCLAQNKEGQNLTDPPSPL